MTNAERTPDLRAVASGVVFLVGAGVYALMQGPGGADFLLTPLTVGIIAIVAGLSSGRRRPLATGLVLAGWGLAVLAIDHDVVDAERVTPAYMLGIGAGLLAAAAVARREHRSELMTSAAITAFLGPLSLYLSYDVEALGRWPAWALTLVGLAAWELFWSIRGLQAQPRAR
ncbi:MAG: hypothetical protein ACR2HM_11200 [Acidimicrobiales bacterium]